MKLLNVGAPGHETPAMLDKDGIIRSLKGVCEPISAAFLAADGLHGLSKINPIDLPIIDPSVRIGAPLLKPGKIIAVSYTHLTLPTICSV